MARHSNPNSLRYDGPDKLRSWNLGDRIVRSAGRKSGSIEITLPVGLMALQGVMCRFELRDGIAAELVLHPDFGSLLPVFDAAWNLLRQSLKRIDDIGEFWEGDYVVGLFPEARLSSRPILAYSDALAIQHSIPNDEQAKSGGIEPVLEAFARIIESLAMVAGTQLGLSMETAAVFANQVAYSASGVSMGTIDAYARGSLLEATAEVGWCRENPWAEETWLAAQARLENILDRCAAWDKEPGAFARERQLWYQARRLETRAQSARV